MGNADSSTVVEVHCLSFEYPPSRRRQTARRALDGVSFTVSAGEIFGLLGPNGGGKTTLFRILATLLVPTGGRAAVFGLDVTTKAEAVRNRIGVVFQSASLDRKLTVMENLVHQGHLYGLWGRELRQRARRLLERVGLADRADERVERLSGGMQRRVEVAKGLLHGPQLLLLDEPSTGLDPGARRDLWDHLRRLCEEEGVTVLVTTHLMDEAERCNRLGVLNAGRLVALDSPEALKSQVGGDVVVVRGREPQKLAADLRARFGGNPIVVDGAIHVERECGHEFITDLVEAFPGRVDSVHLGKPTLEDVFVHYTGHRFEAQGGTGG